MKIIWADAEKNAVEMQWFLQKVKNIDALQSRGIENVLRVGINFFEDKKDVFRCMTQMMGSDIDSSSLLHECVFFVFEVVDFSRGDTYVEAPKYLETKEEWCIPLLRFYRANHFCERRHFTEAFLPARSMKEKFTFHDVLVCLQMLAAEDKKDIYFFSGNGKNVVFSRHGNEESLQIEMDLLRGM